jgi:hypothetical protein
LDPELELFIKVLTPLKEYLSEFVIVGGWVPVLYKHCTPFYNSNPLHTRDIDIACPGCMPVKGKTLNDLLSQAGFTCEMQGDDVPPLCKYVADSDIEIEFLTPLKGRGDVRTRNVQESLSAQTLRYVDILLEHTVELELPSGLVVRVPDLAAFIFQKGLSFPDRPQPMKRDKDLFYIYQVITTVDSDTLATKLLGNIFPAYHAKWADKFRCNLRLFFKTPDSLGPIGILGQIKQIPGYQSMSDETTKLSIYSTFVNFLYKLS